MKSLKESFTVHVLGPLQTAFSGGKSQPVRGTDNSLFFNQ